MANPVHELYGNRARLRACGICIQDSSILLVNHEHVNESDFWAPPGGGLEFGEDARECLIREFREETGLDVSVEEFLFVCEIVRPPLHAVELFFSVSVNGGQLKKGLDPESGGSQIIKEVRFITEEEVRKIPLGEMHGIFRFCRNIQQIAGLKGYFKL